ncbi:MAG TPA: sugar kinase [Streptosporangiaceae bacterium]|nr:sugar kinase [Streptosporangiaceae bacterium]
MIEALTFGEVMAVLRGPGPFRLGGQLSLSVAGAEGNVAIGLARLGHQVAWAGRVGADELGELVVRTLRAEGADVSSVVVDPSRPTGLMLAERRIGDLVRVSYYRSGSAGSQLGPADVLPALVPGVRLLHVTGITLALSSAAREAVAEAVARAHEIGATVSVDVNYRARLWSSEQARAALRPVIAEAGIVIASADELALVSDGGEPSDVAEELLAGGASQVIVKQGADGATAFTADEVISRPARPVVVADLVGAGDAFVAGDLSATLEGLTVEARLDRAAATAAFAIARPGDWEGLPSRQELSLLDLAAGTTMR